MQLALANSLKKGISGLGDRPLDEASFNLQKAGVEHGLARQKAADVRQAGIDARALPGQQVAQQRNQQIINQGKKDFHINMLFPNMNAFEHWNWTSRDNWMDKKAEGWSTPEQKRHREPMISRFATAYGAKFDLDPNSPTRGSLVREDGSRVSVQDVHEDAGAINAFVVANSGLDHTVRNGEEQLQRSLQKGQVTPEQYKAKKAEIERFKNDIPAQIRYAEKRIEVLSRFTNAGNPFYNAEIAEGKKQWEATRDRLATAYGKQQEKADKRKFEMDKLKIEETGKNIRKGADIEQKEMDRIVEIEKMFSKEQIEKGKADKSGGSDKLPANVKGAQELFKHLTKSKSESAGVILAKAMAGMRMGEGVSETDIDTVKAELDEKTRGLLDRSIKILEEYYGVEKKTEDPVVTGPKITHDFIPGQGVVERTQ